MKWNVYRYLVALQVNKSGHRRLTSPLLVSKLDKQKWGGETIWREVKRTTLEGKGSSHAGGYPQLQTCKEVWHHCQKEVVTRVKMF